MFAKAGELLAALRAKFDSLFKTSEGNLATETHSVHDETIKVVEELHSAGSALEQKFTDGLAALEQRVGLLEAAAKAAPAAAAAGAPAADDAGAQKTA